MARYQFVGPRAGRSFWQDAADTFGDVVQGERQRRQQQKENEWRERGVSAQEGYLELARGQDVRAATEAGWAPEEIVTSGPAEVPRSQVFGQPSPADQVGRSVRESGFDQDRTELFRPHTSTGRPSATSTGAAPTHGGVRRVGGMSWDPRRSATWARDEANREHDFNLAGFSEGLQRDRLALSRRYAAEDRDRIAATLQTGGATDPQSRIMAEGTQYYDRLFPDELDPRMIAARKDMERFRSGLRIGEMRARPTSGSGSGRPPSSALNPIIDDTRQELTAAEREAARFTGPARETAMWGEGFDQGQFSADSASAANQAADVRRRFQQQTRLRDLSVADEFGLDPADLGRGEPDALSDEVMAQIERDPEYARYLVEVMGVNEQALARRYADWIRRTKRP